MRATSDATDATDASGTYDVGQFDGSADPNPGGRMGMGWHLALGDGRESTGASERPPAPGNTNNQAEYFALIALLDAYREADGRGPLLVRGDSQLIILQMTGAWAVRQPALAALHTRAREAAQAIPGGVRFEWVPRYLNSRADQLAGGKPAMAAAEPLVYAASPLQNVAPALARQIAALNARGSASFKECLALRVGGRDLCSAMRWGELVAAAGEACVKVCAKAFPDAVPSQATALRWVVRGLAAQLAIRKVRVDQEMLAQRAAKAGHPGQGGPA
jgi:ribonuclease HI